MALDQPFSHQPPAARAPAAKARSMRQEAGEALQTTLAACEASYERRSALRRFHRLSEEIIVSERPESAAIILREIEGALRRERARAGHWTYDLNRHIGLLVACRAEKARLERLRRGGGKP